MVRSELKYCLGDKFSSWQSEDISYATSLVFEIMTQTLVEGGRIELRGFGTFEVRMRAPKDARNPRTRKSVRVGKRGRVHFKPGRAMRNIVDASRVRFPIKTKDLPEKYPVKEEETA
ncbi:HU family DNA-binding protein [Candidatus Synchoanobacter obligatus]|uniref:Integration host factor subunit beta n=1 Tax=Candidatus Synchoanobacter obligatus TaxID=2919597 RepID=A0ABT1L4P3_9GAMM|nr:HU family DNA-binding protein [Candidatus Synchoanobacter obligatus]MCP8352147.1 integration host factor subunit beta [Candidatus Synchoanobacter obligatus]